MELKKGLPDRNGVKAGYKQTEVGMLPSDWKVKELSEIVQSFQLGGNYSNSESEMNNPLIKMGNLSRGAIDLNKLEFITSGSQPSSRDKLRFGDVLFNTRNTLDLVGKVSIWKNELPVAYFNSNIMRLEFKSSEISSNFFMNYVLNTKALLVQLRSIATGTTSVAAIYTRDLLKIKFPVPTKAEQTAIATALSDADALIQSLEKLIAKKHLIKQGAMQELLTPKEDWEVKKLGEICDFQNGTSLERLFNKNEGYSVISIGNYSSSGKYVETNTFIDNVHSDEIAKFLLKKNELTLLMNDKTSIGTIIGRVLLIEQDDKYVFNQRTMRLKPKNNYNSLFLYHLINSGFIHKKIVLLAKPGTQIYVNTNDIIDLELFIPKPEEQTRITTILSDMDAEITELETKLDYTAKSLS